MDKYKCLKILPDDEMYISIIASWYFHEWGIPEADTINRIKGLGADNEEFQVLLTLDGKPIATGGLYNHVGLLNKLPHLKIHKHWLALVYTIPEYRGKGAGSAICMEIERMAGNLGCSVIYLFIYTYSRKFVPKTWLEDSSKIDLSGQKYCYYEKGCFVNQMRHAIGYDKTYYYKLQ